MRKFELTSIHAAALGLALLSLPVTPSSSDASQKSASKSQKAGTSSAKKATQIEIGTRGSELAFDKTSFRVKAGQPVQLKFVNRADPGSGLQHNWVLTQPGADKEVAVLAIQAGQAKGFVPDSPKVLAHSKLLNPGESEVISFTAPQQPGTYPYLCTFPGHAELLKGTMTVE